MRSWLNHILICLCLVGFGGVSEPATAQSKTPLPGARLADLEGHKWHLSNYFVDKKQKWPSHGFRNNDTYLKFESGTIEGSPGCGRFIGNYGISDERLMISAEWRDRKETPCSDEEKAEALEIRGALTQVQQIQAALPELHGDDLFLADAEGSTLITLAPSQPGADLSELQNTFWHLEQLSGSQADFSGVIVNIQDVLIYFTTPSYFVYIPFRYRWAGLEFPLVKHATDEPNNGFLGEFENALQEVQSYERSPGTLAFFDKDRKSIIVLSDFRKEGLENRRWHIAKYRGDGKQSADEDRLVNARLADIIFSNGRVTGSLGCGVWFGTYKLAGNQLHFDAISQLFSTCYPEQVTQSHLVENASKGELRVEKSGDNIILRDNRGKARILLVPY